MAAGSRRTWRLPARFVIPAAISVLVMARLLLLGSDTGGDEAGFLLVGTSWHHGTSLYGDYWVDRPPLLLWITELAGNVTILRMLGCLASVLTVLGVAWAARLVRGAAAGRWAAGAAALFGAAQWLGVARVNGEMLAAPFVAWSFALTILAMQRTATRQVAAALGAGVLAGCAILIKQSVVEPFVFALALSLALALRRRQWRRGVARIVGAGAVGAVGTVCLGLVCASLRGTSPADLFDAVIIFRVEAGEVIRSSASDATPLRLLVMMGTWVASGLAAATTLAGWQAARWRDPVLRAVFATLLCSLVVALFGGSYWAHYLIQMTPAASLAIGLVAGRVPPHLLRGIAAITIAVTAGNLIWSVGLQPDDNARQHSVGAWLKTAGRPGDTAVVAYGQPNIVWEAGMTSPYAYLWSLPVRTRDPDLRQLSAVLRSAERPTWVVDWSGFGSWGIEPAGARAAIRNGYRRVATVCGTSIWLEREASRTLPETPDGCR